MKTKILLAICVMAIALGSCKKEPIKGDKGDKGDNGNANVTSVTLVTSNWTWDATNSWRYATWNNVSILNANVINNGAVMLYQLVATNTYVQLPITQNINSVYQENDWFEYELNSISVIIENTNLSDPNPPSFTYKLVCIPQYIIKNNPNVNWKNYSEVKQALRLKD